MRNFDFFGSVVFMLLPGSWSLLASYYIYDITGFNSSSAVVWFVCLLVAGLLACGWFVVDLIRNYKKYISE